MVSNDAPRTTVAEAMLVNILCAPDKFKGTISAADAAAAMARGVEGAGHDALVFPVGDGGEGTIDCILRSVAGRVITARVTGPLDDPIEARWAMLEDGTAIVELAEASGLLRIPERARNPLRATTFGTGELVALAIKYGCRRIVLCVGGSATVDGGAGAAQALGARLFDAAQREIRSPARGEDLLRIVRVERPAPLPCTLCIACDVRNPLLGARGAAVVYGPQKGASDEQVDVLEKGLRQWASIVGGDADEQGAGAAGGIGFGLKALLGATLVSGAQIVLTLSRFAERLAGADLVLAGEGSLDEQTLEGKALLEVVQAAACAGKPTVAIVGRAIPAIAQCVGALTGSAEFRVFSLVERFGDRSFSDPAGCLARAAEEVLRTIHRPTPT